MHLRALVQAFEQNCLSGNNATEWKSERKEIEIQPNEIA
jgi:hypothetical protein